MEELGLCFSDPHMPADLSITREYTTVAMWTITTVRMRTGMNEGLQFAGPWRVEELGLKLVGDGAEVHGSDTHCDSRLV